MGRNQARVFSLLREADSPRIVAVYIPIREAHCHLVHRQDSMFIDAILSAHLFAQSQPIARWARQR